MALTSREQLELDRIGADLTRRDPYLAAALAEFQSPPGAPRARTTARKGAQILSVRGLVALLGAAVLLWLALWGPEVPAPGCERAGGQGAVVVRPTRMQPLPAEPAAEPAMCNNPGRVLTPTELGSSGDS